MDSPMSSTVPVVGRSMVPIMLSSVLLPAMACGRGAPPTRHPGRPGPRRRPIVAIGSCWRVVRTHNEAAGMADAARQEVVSPKYQTTPWLLGHLLCSWLTHWL